MPSQRWINEHGDVIDAKGREDFIDDEICNFKNASGVEDREYAVRVFNRTHREVTMNEAILEQLATVFQSWVSAQSLTLASAEELLAKPLTDHQRAWLEAFSALWYATDEQRTPLPKGSKIVLDIN